MKILTINVIGIPSGSDSNLIDADVFQDYEAVVVNPINLDRLYGIGRISYANSEDRVLILEDGRITSTMNGRRHDEIKGLLQRGGVVVCFLEPILKYTYKRKHQGKDYIFTITNYDWLIESNNMYSELGTIKDSRGQTIEVIDSGHAFSEYLNIKPSWSAYVDKDACRDWKVLASAFGTHAVSLAKRVGLGHIILLPSDYDYNNGELLERCIVKLLGDREVTPQPNWAKAILVPGQQELISKITEVSDQIDALEKQKKTLIDDNAKLERWKYLLYAKGKHQLEPVVREALALLGCKVEPQPDKDSDGAVTCDYGAALLEVVGSEGTIKIEKLGQLTRNIASFFETKGSRVKGILVGNPFCGEPLDSRPPKDTQKQLFAKELIESAEQLSITVLLSTDLYGVVSRILSDKLPKTEKQSLRERIFNSKGLVRLA
jgi:hypothetical protein